MFLTAKLVCRREERSPFTGPSAEGGGLRSSAVVQRWRLPAHNDLVDIAHREKDASNQPRLRLTYPI